MIRIMISNPQPQMLIDLVRQRPAWDIIPIEDDVPVVIPDQDTWVFVDWKGAKISGLDMCKALRASQASSKLHLNMVLSFDEISEYGAIIKSLAIDLVRGPLTSQRLIEQVEGHPSVDVLEPTQLSVGDLVVDTRAHRVKLKDNLVSLSPTEYQVLVYLLKNTGRVITRSEFILAIGKNRQEIQERAIDVWVSRVRRTLAALGGEIPIRNVKGKGYVLDT
jgi:two-component system phosphate regulon response regulator PhoB